MGQHLQQVVLNHIAHGPAAVVVTTAAADAHGFGGGDLHALYVVTVPERLEEAVGKAGGQQVLYRLLAQVVIDPVDVVFGEEGLDVLVQLFGRSLVVAEGLFHHQPRPAALRLVEARLS